MTTLPQTTSKKLGLVIEQERAGEEVTVRDSEGVEKKAVYVAARRKHKSDKWTTTEEEEYIEELRNWDKFEQATTYDMQQLRRWLDGSYKNEGRTVPEMDKLMLSQSNL